MEVVNVECLVGALSGSRLSAREGQGNLHA